jgi:hypothetical protein
MVSRQAAKVAKAQKISQLNIFASLRKLSGLAGNKKPRRRISGIKV